MLLVSNATEKSTYVVNITFKNELGEAVAPVSALWSLHTTDGTVVNERSQVNITDPQSSEDIVLSGDDLEIFDGEGRRGERVLVVKATYNSDLGNGLPLKAEFRFFVVNITGVE